MAFRQLLFSAIAPFIAISLIVGASTGADSFQTPAAYIPMPQVQRFAFGFQMPMADIFWVRAIQDFDYCDQRVNERDCRGKSWLYSLIEAITELSPDFTVAHSIGALALSVIVSDIEGASLIYDKAVVRFPHSWRIPYAAGTHFLIEEKNREKAAQYYKLAAERGAPTWLYSLSSKLYSETGQREAALMLYQQAVDAKIPEQILKNMRVRLGL